ncbi:hypothetical protein OROHE_018013 [Orobanche hederae]
MIGRALGRDGENGTLSGKACPKGLYGVFCQVIVHMLLHKGFIRHHHHHPTTATPPPLNPIP